MKQKQIDNIEANRGGYGRLKPVSKVRKEFNCRECKEDFPIGVPAYNQSDNTGEGYFPVSTKVCKSCGDKLIKNGAMVKPKKQKEDFGEGCGKDTEYPKPNDRSQMWKCGEKTSIGSHFLCEQCKTTDKGEKAN